MSDDLPSRADRGFTLVELLVAIVVLGVLAGVSVFAVRGINDQGTASACQADRSVLSRATEAYFATYTGTGGLVATQAYPAGTGFASNTAQVAIPAPAGVSAGATPAETLVRAGLIRAVPRKLWLAPSGALIVVDASCGTVGEAIAGGAAIGTGSGGGLGGGGDAPVAFTGVLDGLSTAPEAAYSLRRLATSYEGPLVRVRRASDNAESDIAATAAGELDVDALTTFVAGGDGFVTVWYDQSGHGRHTPPSTQANQYRIASAGVYSGQLYATSTTTAINVPQGFAIAPDVAFTINAVVGAYRTSSASLSQLFVIGNGTNANQRINFGAPAGSPAAGERVRAANDLYAPLAFDTTGPSIVTYTKSSTPSTAGSTAYIDGVSGVSATPNAVSGFSAATIRINSGGQFDVSEVIVFAGVLAPADRQALEQNQGGRYGVGVA